MYYIRAGKRKEKLLINLFLFLCNRSGSIGYGVPPSDTVSTLVIIIISAGLGIPVIIIIFGGIFICIKKKNAKPDKPLGNIQNNGGYQQISDN